MPEVSSEILRQYNLSMDEAAAVLRVSRITLKRWRDKKYGPKPLPFGRVWLYSSEDIDKWLKGLVDRNNE